MTVSTHDAYMGPSYTSTYRDHRLEQLDVGYKLITLNFCELEGCVTEIRSRRKHALCCLGSLPP